jgi:DNA invertase Pin-like site-specific DNA recombinase
MQKEFEYARVSTAHQNTDRQIDALLEYGVDERNIIVDKQSGKDFNRVGYQSLNEQTVYACRNRYKISYVSIQVQVAGRPCE